jgi:hypothetical protein
MRAAKKKEETRQPTPDNTTETVAQHSQHSEAGTNCYVHKLLRTRPQQTADTNGMGTTHPMMVPAVGFDPRYPRGANVAVRWPGPLDDPVPRGTHRVAC